MPIRMYRVLLHDARNQIPASICAAFASSKLKRAPPLKYSIVGPIFRHSAAMRISFSIVLVLATLIFPGRVTAAKCSPAAGRSLAPAPQCAVRPLLKREHPVVKQPPPVMRQPVANSMIRWSFAKPLSVLQMPRKCCYETLRGISGCVNDRAAQLWR